MIANIPTLTTSDCPAPMANPWLRNSRSVSSAPSPARRSASRNPAMPSPPVA